MLKKVARKIFFISEVALIIIVILLFYFAQPLKLPHSQFFIPSGNIQSIIAYMQSKGVALTPLDSYALRFIGYPQRGWINLGVLESSHLDFLYRLATAKAALIYVTLIPGETTYTILNQLSRRFGYDREMLQNEYKKEAPYPEGVFFPNTYALPKGMTEREIAAYLVRVGLLQHKRLSKKFLGSFNQKIWFEKIVTVASIIQKEAANKEEMPIIASVIYNRLKRNMPLQMDGALNYGQFSHTRITPKRIREDTSKFNTYKHLGLPPYPVCIVSKEAIKSALFPAKTKYLYFVKGRNGKHIFSKTYKSHLHNIQSVQKRNRN